MSCQDFLSNGRVPSVKVCVGCSATGGFTVNEESGMENMCTAAIIHLADIIVWSRASLQSQSAVMPSGKSTCEGQLKQDNIGPS
jgi:hypothetical protein